MDGGHHLDSSARIRRSIPGRPWIESSVRYKFEQDETIAERHLVPGQLAMVESEILRPDRSGP